MLWPDMDLNCLTLVEFLKDVIYMKKKYQKVTKKHASIQHAKSTGLWFHFKSQFVKIQYLLYMQAVKAHMSLRIVQSYQSLHPPLAQKHTKFKCACFCYAMSDWITSKICDKYCRKQFDVFNYVAFCWMTCCFMRLARLQFEMKLQKCIRMGITIFKIFIWGGIFSDIGSEI